MNTLYSLRKKIMLVLTTLLIVLFTNNLKATCNFHAGFTFSPSSNNCKQINFTNTSYVTNSNDSGVSYIWESGSSIFATTRNSSFTFSSNGTYTICLIMFKQVNGNYCSDTSCQTITVNCNTCNFGIKNPYFSVGDSCNWLSGYIGPNQGCYKYTWKVNSTVVSHDRFFSHYNITANGTYNICVNVVDTCANCDTTYCGTRTITCFGSNSCNFGIKNPYFSVGDSCTWLSGYFGSSQGCYKYTWKVNSTVVSHDRFFSHYNITANGTYNICLNVVDTCANCDTTYCGTRTITCFGNHSCNFGIKNPYFSVGDSCTWLSGYFGTSQGCYKYTWKVNSTVVSHDRFFSHYNITANGTYNICLNVVDTCANCDTTYCGTRTITCFGNHTCNFGIKNPYFSLSDSCNWVSGYIGPNQGCNKYTWKVNSTVVSHDRFFSHYAITANGTYNICVNVVDTCSNCDTTYCGTRTITCFHSCNSRAYFGATVNCPNKKVEVINYSYGDTCMNYFWFWGDGSSSTAKNPGSHTYSSTGTYNLCLKVIKCNDSTCFNYYCKTIVIPSVCCPVPNFYFYNFCNTYRFINTTQGGTSFWWSFGDSSFASQKSPYHSFFSKRTFQVCLTVFDSVKNCSATVCKSVTVNCGWFGGGNHFEVPLSDGNIGEASRLDHQNTDLTPSKGLQMNTRAGITAYPNPTHNLLNIILPSGNVTVKITDITGAVLMQFDNVSSFFTANVSNLSAGVYFVNVVNESGIQSVRFMKD